MSVRRLGRDLRDARSRAVRRGGTGGDGGSSETGGTTMADGTVTTTTTVGSTAPDSSSADDVSSDTVGELEESGAPDVCDPPCATASAPLCVGGECVACTQALDGDAGCAEKFPNLPACHEDGRCVACTETNTSGCPAEAPACDLATSECVPCVEHEQCPASACDLATGMCFATNCVRHVDGDGGQEFTTISDAIADLETGDVCTIVVHDVESGSEGYVEDVAIAGMTLAVVAGDGRPKVMGMDSAGLVVFEGALVYASGLDLVGASHGVTVTLAEVHLDRIRIFDTVGSGVLVNPSALATLRNSMISVPAQQPGIEATFGMFEVSNSTIVTREASPIGCSIPGPDTVRTVRNSIVMALAHDGLPFCASTESSHNVLEAEIAGEGNVAVGEQLDVDAWFVQPDAAVGDLHLTADGAATFDGVGLWQPGDPVRDLDGDPRPTRSGPDMPGADVPAR